MYLSTLTIVSVKAVANTKTACVDTKAVTHGFPKRVSVTNSMTETTTKLGWAIKPTPKSETASPKTNTLEGVCSEGVLQMAPNAIKFPSNVIRENTPFMAQTAMKRTASLPCIKKRTSVLDWFVMVDIASLAVLQLRTVGACMLQTCFAVECHEKSAIL